MANSGLTNDMSLGWDYRFIFNSGIHATAVNGFAQFVLLVFFMNEAQSFLLIHCRNYILYFNLVLKVKDVISAPLLSSINCLLSFL